MNDSISTKNKRTERLVFCLSIGTLAFWSIGQVMDVYKFALVGAIYELLWLPFLLLLFGIPVVSIFFWAKAKFRIRSLFLPTIIISLTLFAGMILS